MNTDPRLQIRRLNALQVNNLSLPAEVENTSGITLAIPLGYGSVPGYDAPGAGYQTFFFAFGHTWKFFFHPKGQVTPQQTRREVSIFIQPVCPCKVTAKFSFLLVQSKPQALFEPVRGVEMKTGVVSVSFPTEMNGCYGIPDFMNQEAFYHQTGQLQDYQRLEIILHLSVTTNSVKPNPLPANCFFGPTAVFPVTERTICVEVKTNPSEKSEKSKCFVRLSKLKELAPVLAPLAAKGDFEITVPSMETALLFFGVVEFGQVPKDEICHVHALGLLKLADQYGFIFLKLHMESYIARWKAIDIFSTLEMLTLATANNCSLLTDWCLQTVLAAAPAFALALETNTWKMIMRESFEMHCEVVKRLHMKTTGKTLRPLGLVLQDLHEHNLSVDGLRTTLEERLAAFRNPSS